MASTRAACMNCAASLRAAISAMAQSCHTIAACSLRAAAARHSAASLMAAAAARSACAMCCSALTRQRCTSSPVSWYQYPPRARSTMRNDGESIVCDCASPASVARLKANSPHPSPRMRSAHTIHTSKTPMVKETDLRGCQIDGSGAAALSSALFKSGGGLWCSEMGSPSVRSDGESSAIAAQAALSASTPATASALTTARAFAALHSLRSTAAKSVGTSPPARTLGHSRAALATVRSEPVVETPAARAKAGDEGTIGQVECATSTRTAMASPIAPLTETATCDAATVLPA
mmetsp:Transcript_44556/g.131557  ORF Transcript_44556/g.131557 Transcript_44556/m.131557 type:complete len:291 (-) Transcript_44556:714-1586(-)|eukprot:1642701-Prymnesium_polylepis.2